MEWYLKVLRQYSDFNGRARRKEYWMFVLFNFIFSVGAVFLDSILGLSMAGGYGIIYLIYMVVVIVPGIAVTVRRLHDIGKSGIMILVGLIPLVGAIWLIVLTASEGMHGPNQYGPDPKANEI